MFSTDAWVRFLHVPVETRKDEVLKELGYLPVISSFSGSVRAFSGAVKVIRNVSRYAFNNATVCTSADRKERFACQQQCDIAVGEVSKGFSDLFRGTIETVPLLGNSLVVFVDRRFEVLVAEDYARRNECSFSCDMIKKQRKFFTKNEA
jgi:hypothetical protein